MEEVTNVTQEQQNIGLLSHNMKYLTNRLVNTEMALDVFLGILFEKDDTLKDTFEKMFKERMESIRQQYEEQEKKQAEALANQATEEDNVDIIVTPNGDPA